MADRDMADKLAELDLLATAQLQQRWCALTGGPVPRVSRALLRLALAWHIQARAEGGLPARTLRTLDQLARGKTATRALRPGMQLMREWNGVLHVVSVEEDGALSWNEKRWCSLSEIARAITGTRWSGPAFFGLKHKRQSS